MHRRLSTHRRRYKNGAVRLKCTARQRLVVQLCCVWETTVYNPRSAGTRIVTANHVTQAAAADSDTDTPLPPLNTTRHWLHQCCATVENSTGFEHPEGSHLSSIRNG